MLPSERGGPKGRTFLVPFLTLCVWLFTVEGGEIPRGVKAPVARKSRAIRARSMETVHRQ
jgi:hypothetical protein